MKKVPSKKVLLEKVQRLSMSKKRSYVFILSFAALGTALLLLSFAAISGPNFWEAEDGTLSCAELEKSDGTRTYVEFGSCSSSSGELVSTYKQIAADLRGMPHSKDVADVDGDGLLDIIVATHKVVKASSLPGNENPGIFWYQNPSWTQHRIANGSFSTDLEAKDVDGDGRPDVVTTDFDASPRKVMWFKNPVNAASIWTGQVVGDMEGHDVSIAQLDGTGFAEIVARGSNSFTPDPGDGDTIKIFSRSGSTWTVAKTITTIKGEGIEVGHINSDGRLDIVAGPRWFKNPGTLGGAWTSYTANTSYTSTYNMHTKVNVGDINGDGRNDIVLAVAEPGTNRADMIAAGLYKPVANAPVVWLEAPVDPEASGWTMRTVGAMSDETHGVVVADFNDDGRNDIAAAEMEQSDNKKVKLFLSQNAAGTSWTPQEISSEGSHNLIAADMDGNGYPDLVGANHGWNLKNADGGDTPIQMWSMSKAYSGPLNNWNRNVVGVTTAFKNIFVVTADFNGDGRKDVAAGDKWYRNNGGGTSWTASPMLSTNFIVAMTADIDRDGDMDLFGTEQGGTGSLNCTSAASCTKVLVWFQNDGAGNFTRRAITVKGTGDFLQGVTLLKFDRKIVLSWHKEDSIAGVIDHTALQFLNIPADPTASGAWTINNVTGLSKSEEINAYDLDGDGDEDIVGGTHWSQRTGTGPNDWTSRLLHSTTLKGDRNRVGFLNNDTKPDVFIGFEGVNAEQWYAWYKPSAGAITSPWVLGRTPPDDGNQKVYGPMSVSIGDVDRDGDQDVALGEHATTLSLIPGLRLSVLQNDGNGNLTRRVVHTGDEHHDGAQFVDLDNDGDLDIVSIGWTHNEVRAYINED